MPNTALLIGLENYADAKIHPIPFAAADLAAIAQVFEALELSEREQLLRLNAQATKSGIESDLRAIARRLTKDATLFVFYVGYGFSLDGTNYLTCYDSRRDDLAKTSVALQDLFDAVSSSNCERICFFLNASHHGLSTDLSMGTLLAHLDDTVLKKSIAAKKHAACFLACRSNEESHSSAHLKQSVWTYHIVEALCGDAAAAMFESRCLTAASLQNYLSRAVPRTLRSEFATPIIQTPWMCGGMSDDFVVADLTGILDRRRLTSTSPAPRLESVAISATKIQSVKSLPGFKKSHRVPESKNSSADAFIANITESALQSDLEATFRKLKETYRFKRLDLEKRGPADGAGVIATPYFEYAIFVELDADDTAQVIWRRAISKITDPSKIFCDEFDRVFAGVFDTIEISNGQQLDVTAVIDRIEQLDDGKFEAEYDADCTECRVRVAGSTTTIHVTTEGLCISDRLIASPNDLLQAAMSIQLKLTTELGLKPLSVT